MDNNVFHIEHEDELYKEYTEHFPYVGEDAIYIPVYPVTEKGIDTAYRKVITKELFVEAYNKWIKGESDE